jgi:hypothetical protein
VTATELVHYGPSTDERPSAAISDPLRLGCGYGPAAEAAGP